MLSTLVVVAYFILAASQWASVCSERRMMVFIA